MLFTSLVFFLNCDVVNDCPILGLFFHCDVVPDHEVDFFVVFGNGNYHDNVHVINQGDKFITFVVITMVGATCFFFLISCFWFSSCS